jgi:succinoglycan biosynthesis protein ExoA
MKPPQHPPVNIQHSVPSAIISEPSHGAPATDAPVKISVLIPTYNEADYIENVLDGVLAARPRVHEVLVADGESEDATRALVAEVAARDPRVKLIENPDRIQSAGLNRAAGAADPASEVLIRLDAHSSYPPDFIQRLLDALEETGAASVVVRLHSVGDGCFQRAVAVLSNTLVATGGAAHRMGGKSGFVDHGHHAAFVRSAFDRAGGYDESFVAAEDAELDYRIRSQGGKIWFASDIIVDYFPRDTLLRLARQYYRNGAGRAQAVHKNKHEIRLRQVIPPIWFCILACSLLGSLLQPWLLVVPIGYVVAMGGVSAGLAVIRRDPCMLAGVAALPVIHITWAAGFLRSYFLGPPRRALAPKAPGGEAR